MPMSGVCMCQQVTRGRGRGMFYPWYFKLYIYMHTVCFKIELQFMTIGILVVACLQLDYLTKLHTAAAWMFYCLLWKIPY